MLVLECSENVQSPYLIVELEDDQHVNVMSNLPLTCYLNTAKGTVGEKFGLQTVRSGGFVLDQDSLNRMLVDVQSVHIMSKAG